MRRKSGWYYMKYTGCQMRLKKTTNTKHRDKNSCIALEKLYVYESYGTMRMFSLLKSQLQTHLKSTRRCVYSQRYTCKTQQADIYRDTK